MWWEFVYHYFLISGSVTFTLYIIKSLLVSRKVG